MGTCNEEAGDRLTKVRGAIQKFLPSLAHFQNNGSNDSIFAYDVSTNVLSLAVKF